MKESECQDVMMREFGKDKIRQLGEGKQTMFGAVDSAVLLGYKDPSRAIRQHCKGRVKRLPLQTAGGVQEVAFISIPDVFRLIAHSKLPKAQEFERWIYEDVLVGVYESGGYINPNATNNQISILSSQLAEMSRRNGQLEKYCDSMERLFAEYRQNTLPWMPKVNYGDIAPNGRERWRPRCASITAHQPRRQNLLLNIDQGTFQFV